MPRIKKGWETLLFAVTIENVGCYSEVVVSSGLTVFNYNFFEFNIFVRHKWTLVDPKSFLTNFGNLLNKHVAANFKKGI